jgi:hypothetical protein
MVSGTQDLNAPLRCQNSKYAMIYSVFNNSSALLIIGCSIILVRPKKDVIVA